MAKQSLLTRIKANARNRDKNANATLHLIGEAIDGYAQNGDWTNLAWIVSLATGRADRGRIEAIIEAASGIKFKLDEKQPTGLRKAKGDAGENNKLGLLAQYAASGVSFRSASLENDDELPALLSKKEAKQRTIEERMLAAVRGIRKDHPTATKARIIAALNAALESEFKS